MMMVATRQAIALMWSCDRHSSGASFVTCSIVECDALCGRWLRMAGMEFSRGDRVVRNGMAVNRRQLMEVRSNQVAEEEFRYAMDR